MNAITHFDSAKVTALRSVPSIVDVDAAVASIAATETAAPADHGSAPAAAEAPEPLVAPAPVVTERKVSALVPRAELAAAVAACTRIVERRNVIPILANVLLRGTDAGLEVIGTDLDIVVTVPVPCPVDPTFATTLPAHTLCDLLKKAKASDMVAIDVVQTTTEGARVESDGEYKDGQYRKTEKLVPFRSIDESVQLDFAGLTLTMQGLAPADFPAMDVPTWSNTFTLATADLTRALARTEFCISTEETRYYLNRTYMHIGALDGLRPGLIFAATDGHRMGVAELPQPDGCGYMPGVIVPAKTVKEVLRMAKAKGAPEHATIQVSEGGAKVQFTVGDVVMLSKAIDGTYPDYQRVVPSGNDKRMALGRDDFADAVKQVSVISSERGRAVKLACERSMLTLTVSNPDTGTAKTSVEVEYDSDPLDIGFNSEYLLHILANVESDRAVVMLADPGSPTLIRGDGEEDKGVYYVLMPMRV